MTHATSTKSTPRETPYSLSAVFLFLRLGLGSSGDGDVSECFRLREGDDGPGSDASFLIGDSGCFIVLSMRWHYEWVVASQ